MHAEPRTVIRRFEPLKKSLTQSPTKLLSPGRVPRRGEVWWVRLDPALGSEIRKTRPCLVFTTNIVNQYRRTAVVDSAFQLSGEQSAALSAAHVPRAVCCCCYRPD